MARHRILPEVPPVAGFIVDETTAKMAEKMNEWTDGKLAKLRAKAARPKTPPKFTPGQLTRALKELEEFLTTGDWSSATPKHFFALYVRLHSKLYGVVPIMTNEERMRAVQRAGWFLRVRFDGDPTEFALYMRWVWKGEVITERRSKEENRERTWRMNWHSMFSDSRLTDYVVFTARQRGNDGN